MFFGSGRGKPNNAPNQAEQWDDCDCFVVSEYIHTMSASREL
jgi:hypothetical protein